VHLEGAQQHGRFCQVKDLSALEHTTGTWAGDKTQTARAGTRIRRYAEEGHGAFGRARQHGQLGATLSSTDDLGSKEGRSGCGYPGFP
jgi:hypothetical protein